VSGQDGEIVAGSLGEKRQMAEAHDWLLERWIRLAEVGVEVGVTLQIGGLLISGTLVGAGKYLEHQRMHVVPGLLERGLPPALGRKLEQAFAADVSAIAEAEAGVDDERQFIHLRDAWLIAGGGQRFFVPFWRGRLRGVDGFVLGVLREDA
jgi:hypothetical protein